MVGIFLDPQNTNDRFFFSYTNSNWIRYSMIYIGDVTKVDDYSQ